MFQAEVGVGLGLGAFVQVPLVLHTGLNAGFFGRFGHNYAEGWQSDGRFEASYNALLLHEAQSGLQILGKGSDEYDHSCYGLLPLLWDSDTPEPYALKVELQLIVLSVTLAINPWFLSNTLWPPPAQEVAEVAYCEAIAHIGKGENDKAIEALTRSIDQMASAYTLFLRAGLYERAGKPRLAVEDLGEAMARSPPRWLMEDVLAMRARLNLSLRDRDAAEADLKQLRELDPERAEAVERRMGGGR